MRRGIEREDEMIKRMIKNDYEEKDGREGITYLHKNIYVNMFYTRSSEYTQIFICTNTINGHGRIQKGIHYSQIICLEREKNIF